MAPDNKSAQMYLAMVGRARRAGRRGRRTAGRGQAPRPAPGDDEGDGQVTTVDLSPAATLEVVATVATRWRTADRRPAGDTPAGSAGQATDPGTGDSKPE